MHRLLLRETNVSIDWAKEPMPYEEEDEQNGVHFLSTCAHMIDWIEKCREIWDKSSSTMRLGRFLRLRLTINDSYNLNMINVDIGDQLRGNYRPAHWMQ